MAPQAEDLDDDTVLALAAHFAALPARANDGPADLELMARGPGHLQTF
jgi:cytochrome c553